jgi:amidase
MLATTLRTLLRGSSSGLTTGDSLALEGARAKDDATVVKLLRDAGVVILGKANLTDMSSGYSSLGGQ